MECSRCTTEGIVGKDLGSWRCYKFILWNKALLFYGEMLRFSLEPVQKQPLDVARSTVKRMMTTKFSEAQMSYEKGVKLKCRVGQNFKPTLIFIELGPEFHTYVLRQGRPTLTILSQVAVDDSADTKISCHFLTCKVSATLYRKLIVLLKRHPSPASQINIILIHPSTNISFIHSLATC